MRIVLVAALAISVSACGVETASTAATAAAAKKQEVEQGRRTMDQAAGRAAEAMNQGQDRLREADK
jgi:hypothetical protein